MVLGVVGSANDHPQVGYEGLLAARGVLLCLERLAVLVHGRQVLLALCHLRGHNAETGAVERETALKPRR